MSSYYDDDRRRHGSSRTYEPEYVEETTYISRGSRAPATELVYRTREDSVEDIPRAFAPGSEYRRGTYRDDDRSRRTRSQGTRGYYDDGYDDDYSEYGPPPGRRRRDDDYYSDDYSRSDRPRERRKSKIEELAEGVGLGGLVAAVTNGGKSRRGSRSDSSEDHGTRSRSQETRRKWQQAAKAAVITGVIEAVRSRNEPGGWAGPKGQRALTAALGAAAVDGFVDRDPEKKSTRHIIEAVVGGLAANRLANGPREQSDGRGRSSSRGRSDSVGGSRSRSRSGMSIRDRFRSLSRGRSASRGPDGEARKGNSLKEIAAIGGVAAVGKAIYDRVRSKSRGRTDRSASVGSEDSFVPNRRQRYRNRDREDNEGSRDVEANDDNRVARRRDNDGENTALARKKRDSSSDSISTTDLEDQRKKNKRSELLTAGLATVATIHAAHGVYSSMVASEKRRKLVSEGEMSTEEARKRKSKNVMQDVAAVGIAALGIKSAFSEWKEMNEQRHEVLELEKKKRKRTKKREQREREMKENGGDNQYNRGDDPGYPYIPQGALGPSSYADGNPYGSSAAAGRYV